MTKLTTWIERRAKRKFNQSGRQLIVYSAFPKSASMHLLNLIQSCSIPEIKVVVPKLQSGYGHNFFSEKKVHAQLSSKHLLMYGHIPFLKYNEELITDLSKTPDVIISIRSLPDIVVSYKEHADNNGFGPLDFFINNTTECHPGWHQLSDKQKYDYIIHFIIPWYIRFVAGWFEASKKWNVNFFTFEEHTGHPAECMSCIAELLNLDLDQKEIENLRIGSNVKKVNYNKGESGRGKKLLMEEQVDFLEKLVMMQGNNHLPLNLLKYLIHGYSQLDVDPIDMIDMKRKKGIKPPTFS